MAHQLTPVSAPPQPASSQFDGSHTLIKKGGAAIGYEGHEAKRTTNALFLTDNHGQQLAVAMP